MQDNSAGLPTCQSSDKSALRDKVSGARFWFRLTYGYVSDSSRRAGRLAPFSQPTESFLPAGRRGKVILIIKLPDAGSQGPSGI